MSRELPTKSMTFKDPDFLGFWSPRAGFIRLPVNGRTDDGTHYVCHLPGCQKAGLAPMMSHLTRAGLEPQLMPRGSRLYPPGSKLAALTR